MVNKINELPQSEQLNISALSRLFGKTTNSYKYLFFISILDILDRRDFEEMMTISFRDLIIEMLANAWYPHNYFKLSFGVQDKISEKLCSIELSLSRFKEPDKKELRSAIAEQNLDEILDSMKRYVPFRLIIPFLEQELKGIDRNYAVDIIVPKLSINYFKTRQPLYCFDSSEYRQCQAIVLHPEWIYYIKTNYSIVRGWVSWKWLEYMQRCNPTTPAIANKLFPPQNRESLASQTKYWKLVLEEADVKCIYSNLTLTTDSLSLDHYLPWSFVTHNQMWNLVPTLKAVNSAKSNHIPSTERYFNKFVELQHLGLTISHEKMTSQKWDKYVENFLLDLKITNKKDLWDLQMLRAAYQSTVTPLISIATNQGFRADWYYKK